MIDWFGQWSAESLFQVGFEFTKSLDLGDGLVEEADEPEQDGQSVGQSPQEQRLQVSTQREAVVSTLVYVHESVTAANAALSAAHAGGRNSHVTPRHFVRDTAMPHAQSTALAFCASPCSAQSDAYVYV